LKLLGLMAAVCAATACGSSDPEDCADIAPSGTYKLHYDEKSGNCDLDLPDSLVSLSSIQAEPDAGCTVISSSESANECRVDFDIDCALQADNVRLRETGYLEIQDDKGEEISGTITFIARRLDNNSPICTGTYEVTLTKQ